MLPHTCHLEVQCLLGVDLDVPRVEGDSDVGRELVAGAHLVPGGGLAGGPGRWFSNVRKIW